MSSYCQNCQNVLQLFQKNLKAENHRRKHDEETIRHFQNLSHELLNIISNHHIQLPQELVRKTLVPIFSTVPPQSSITATVSPRIRLIDACDEAFGSTSADGQSIFDTSMSARPVDHKKFEKNFAAKVVCDCLTY